MEHRRLFIMPEHPGNLDGYAIVVQEDLSRNLVAESDTVVYAEKRSLHEKFFGLFRGEASAYKLPAIPDISSYDEIFIGDVVLVPLVSSKVNEWRNVTIRFHNLYLRYLFSGTLLRSMRSLSAAKLLFLSVIMAGTELRALRRGAKSLHFISKEDAAVAARVAHRASIVKHYCFDEVEIGPPRKITTPQRLIWFGGVQRHKKHGLERFLSEVFSKLRINDSRRFTLELYGSGTENYNNPEIGVFGHGFFSGEGLPLGGDGIFIVPDTEGIGVKIKVRNLLKDGCWFISTEEGVIGYDLPVVPNVVVAKLEEWRTLIPYLATSAEHSISTSDERHKEATI